MRASMEAGLAFSNASLGAVHALAHSLGGWANAPHGECNAALLRAVVEFNWPEAGGRYLELAERAGLAAPGKADKEGLLKTLDRLIAESGLEEGLGIDIPLEDIGQMAVRALSDPCMLTNPRACTQKDLEKLYEKALSGKA